jgi:hypothetical protein
MAPLGNFTVRLASLEAAPLGGSTAAASDDAAQEPSAAQSPLNSRRFSNRISTIRSHVVGRDGGSAVVVNLAAAVEFRRDLQNFCLFK